jgi:hypothetical protein
VFFFVKLKDGKIVRKKQTNVALIVDVNGAVKKEKEEKEKVERTNEMLLEEVSHQRKQMAAMQGGGLPRLEQSHTLGKGFFND